MLTMDSFISAILGDLVSRSVSFVIDNYHRWQRSEDENLQRLLQMLLRVHVIIEEAEGRHITNWAMLKQLQMLREMMYKGLYLLDTSRYRMVQPMPDDKVGGHPFLQYKFSPAKRMCFSTRKMNTPFLGDKVKEIQNTLGNLRRIIDDMKEFIVFLKSYPPISREPYSKYLFLENCMFGRQAEMENIISFLLQQEPAGVERLQVLPIAGPQGVGKKLQQLQRVLLRVGATVEEAEGRFITNQAMLLQLEMLRQGMYEGHYMLDAFRSRAVALRPAKLPLPFPVSSSNTGHMAMDGETVKNFEKMLDRLDSLMSDMREFVVFLEGYPRISRQPYSTYLILDRVMFGRQTETETVINFLLRPAEASGDGKLGVLPIVGVARVGKSTLVEHVCLDERVRRHFSSIAVFTGGGDLCDGNMAALTNSGRIIKHQDHTHGRRRSLAVIELDGDMDHETWRKLYSSATRVMEHGSKIIVTSRSEKVASFGTAQALRLTYLTDEAYWYFFKAIAFGSVNPDDDPRLVYMAMEIAGLNKASFMGANIVGSLMRANLNYKFWSRVLQCVRDFTSKHLLMYGEHPKDLLLRGRPVHMCNMVRTRNAVTICQVFRTASPQNRSPELPTAQDVIAGRDTDQGDFGMLWWRSTIPPYQTYLARCVSQKIGCSMDNKKRPRQCMI